MNPQDEDHLKILSILNYVFGGMGLLFSFFPIIYVIMGAVILADPEAMSSSNGQPPPPAVGWVLVGMGGCGMVMGFVGSTLTIMVGRSLGQRKRWLLCFIMACLQCIQFPLGTCLGVFSIIVLNRPAVKQAFGRT
ncbi:MAG: hypothetical protein U0939_14120 [Pirellulales bacterium]